MQQVIENKRFDTATAERVATFKTTHLSCELSGCRKTLYKTQDGQYFLHKEQWKIDDESVFTYEPPEPDAEELKLLSNEEALKWCEVNDIDDEVIQDEFQQVSGS